MTLGQMREILAANGTRLTRSLGQNFLHDANQIRRIVRLAGLTPGDRVLEIGPGLGPLTEELLRHWTCARPPDRPRRAPGGTASSGGRGVIAVTALGAGGLTASHR